MSLEIIFNLNKKKKKQMKRLKESISIESELVMNLKIWSAQNPEKFKKFNSGETQYESSYKQSLFKFSPKLNGL